MKFLPFLLALTLLGVVASGASAAPRSTASADNLCNVGKSVAGELAKSGSAITPSAGTSLAALQKQMKAEFSSIKAKESVVLANSPASLKPHFVRAFAFVNLVYAKLSAANWNILALEKDATSLAARAQKIRPDVAAIDAYFAKCKK